MAKRTEVIIPQAPVVLPTVPAHIQPPPLPSTEESNAATGSDARHEIAGVPQPGAIWDVLPLPKCADNKVYDLPEPVKPRKNLLTHDIFVQGGARTAEGTLVPCSFHTPPEKDPYVGDVFGALGKPLQPGTPNFRTTIPKL